MENYYKVKLMGKDRTRLQLIKGVVPHKFVCQSRGIPTSREGTIKRGEKRTAESISVSSHVTILYNHFFIRCD